MKRCHLTLHGGPPMILLTDLTDFSFCIFLHIDSVDVMNPWEDSWNTFWFWYWKKSHRHDHAVIYRCICSHIFLSTHVCTLILFICGEEVCRTTSLSHSYLQHQNHGCYVNGVVSADRLTMNFHNILYHCVTFQKHPHLFCWKVKEGQMCKTSGTSPPYLSSSEELLDLGLHRNKAQ